MYVTYCDYLIIASDLFYAAELHPEFEELEKLCNHEYGDTLCDVCIAFATILWKISQSW